MVEHARPAIPATREEIAEALFYARHPEAPKGGEHSLSAWSCVEASWRDPLYRQAELVQSWLKQGQEENADLRSCLGAEKIQNGALFLDSIDYQRMIAKLEAENAKQDDGEI